MWNGIWNQIWGALGWIGNLQPTAQLVAVAVLTAFFTACITEPTKVWIAERRRQRHWRHFIYEELASIYAEIMWDLDHAFICAHQGKVVREQQVSAEVLEQGISARIGDIIEIPYRTPRFDIARAQPDFYQLPEARTIERLYAQLNRSFGPRPDQVVASGPNPVEGNLSRLMAVVQPFRLCLRPAKWDFNWRYNSFVRPSDHPLKSSLFCRYLSRKDRQKEQWALEAYDSLVRLQVEQSKDSRSDQAEPPSAASGAD